METTFCEKHWQPFSEGGERGEINPAAAPALLARKAFTVEKLFVEAFEIKNGYKPRSDTPLQADIPDSKQPGVDELQEAVEEYGPVCCFLSGEELNEIYNACRI